MDKFSINSAVKLSNNRRNSTPMFQAETPKEEARKKIISTARRDAGKYISFPDEAVTGLFVGAVMKDNWPHFVLIDKDRKAQYVRSDSTFKIIKEVPANLSILDYLLQHQEDFIYEVAENAMNADNVEALTKVTVNYGRERREASQNNQTRKFSNKNNKKSNNRK